MLTAILVVLLALALVIIGYLLFLFVDIRTHFSEITYTSTPEPASADFYRALVGMTYAHTGETSFSVFPDSRAFFEQFLKDVAGAKRSISIMVYIWGAGELSARLLTALTEACARGVSVRVMVDYQASAIEDDPHYVAFTVAGGRFHFFRKPHIWELPRYYRRNHQRAFVIDGTRAYTGGVAVRDDWWDETQGAQYWCDLMVAGDGKFALDMQGIFARQWTATTGEMLSGEDFYLGAIQRGLALQVERSGANDTPTSHPYALIASSPHDNMYPAQFTLLFAIACARREIVIATPYFIPTPQLLKLLERKAQSGVRVVIITLAEATEMEQVTRHASHVSYGSLLAAGVAIYEYAPSLYHVKGLVIDSEVAIVGTANFDIRSMKLNDEVVVVIQSNAFASELRAVFEQHRNQSRRIEKDPWARRGFLKRAVERMIAPFSEQL